MKNKRLITCVIKDIPDRAGCARPRYAAASRPCLESFGKNRKRKMVVSKIAKVYAGVCVCVCVVSGILGKLYTTGSNSEN